MILLCVQPKKGSLFVNPVQPLWFFYLWLKLGQRQGKKPQNQG